MYRILIHIGNFKIYSFGVMQAIAYITAIYIALYYGKKRGFDQDKLIDLALWIVLGAIIGARFWFVLEMWELYANDIGSIFKIWEGGLVFYGGFIGGIVALIVYTRKNRWNLITILDIFAPSLPIGIAIGRIGCFLNGCCYGKICYNGGISFPAKNFPPPYADQLHKGLINIGAKESLPVIPTQLYSSLDNLIIFLVLIFLASRIKIKGILIATLFVLYGLHRFIIDYFRAYSGTAFILKFITLSQFLSLIIIITGIVGITISLKRKVPNG